MPGISIPLTAVMHDGTEHKVMVDQRDVAAFELAHRIAFTRVHTECLAAFMRWTAWHSLRRTGKIDGRTKFDAFDEQLDYASDEAPEDEPEVEGATDPTSPAQSGENSSN